MKNLNHNGRRIVALTNIPTPYRIHFYQAMAKELQKRHTVLEVLFMAATRPGRYWSIDPDQWSFAHRFSNNLPIYFLGQPMYMNPDIILRILREPPDCLLISGAWFYPTTQVSLWLLQNKRSRKFFWSESNMRGVRFANGPISRWRSIAYRAFDGYIVPGKMAEEYLFHFCPEAHQRPVIRLPNLVDETLYAEGVDSHRVNKQYLRQQFNLSDDTKVLLMVARLVPIKGILELLKAQECLDTERQRKFILLIAGEGLQRLEIEAFLRQHDLNNVRLLGHLRSEEILKYYAIADGFILPSLGDPYPLAVTEAMFAGLPLLLSKNVGCHPEALEGNLNGWVFDPLNAKQMRKVLQEFIEADWTELAMMGRVSQKIAASKFSTRKVIPDFVDRLFNNL